MFTGVAYLVPLELSHTPGKCLGTPRKPGLIPSNRLSTPRKTIGSGTGRSVQAPRRYRLFSEITTVNPMSMVVL